MLHKKRKPSTFTSSSGVDCKYGTAKNNMLHSKSTYFYRWLSNLGIARRSYNSAGDISNSKVGHDFANEFRESSHHCEKSNTASGTAHAILTRSRRQTNSYSKITDRPSYVVPVGCSLALLLGIGIMLNPATNISSIDKAYAETITANPTDYSSISLTISHSNTDGSSTELNTGDTVSTNVEPGLVSYITNNLRIDTKKINRFYVSIQAAEDGSSELTGMVNKATIAPVGNNKIPTATDENGFGDNTWGFALGEASVDNSSMSYNSLPAYGTSTTPQYSSASNLADGTYNLKLTFAAKINADKPSDHYTTKAMVSVAADAKYISGFINLDTDQPITTMQEMTPNICKYAPDGYSTQLKDSRDDKLYWVSKVNSQCIMTQNLDYDLNTAVPLTPDDSDVRSNWTPTANTLTGTSWSWNVSDHDIVQSYDPGPYYINDAIGSWSACNETKNPATCNRYTAITNSNTTDANLHYAVGNYYSYNAATAGSGPSTAIGENALDSICSSGWKLFDNSGIKSFRTIITGATYDNVRKDPYYFPAAGYVSSGGLLSVGSRGNDWSSTRYSSNYGAHALFFREGSFSSQFADSRFYGFSVRCVVSGA